MAVEVMAWNVLDAFSDEARARDVLQVVREQRPSVMVFSEAWREDHDELLDLVLEDLEASGYAAVQGLYDDDDGRQDRHGILGIVRHELMARKPQLIRLGSRNAVHIPLIDETGGTYTAVDFFGAHLDDRSEQRRLAQAERLIGAAALSKRAVVGGDLNAMHHSDPRARLLRMARPIARCLPTIEPQPDFKPPKVRRIGSLVRRATEMAIGATLRRFEEAGFTDTDPKRRATKAGLNLDHLLVRGLAAFADQRTHAKSALSDHRAISVLVMPC